MVEMELVISSRFKQLLPPLNPDELKQLEENIVKDGRVRDPIIYWHDGKKNLIVDGMNRYAIAREKKLPFRSEPMEFTTIEEVELWMLNNALGRRNLMKPHEVRKVRGELYNRLKGTSGGSRGANPPKGASDHFDTTVQSAAKHVAERSGVSEPTVKRDGKYADAVDKLASPMRKIVDEGKAKVTDAEVQALAKADTDTQTKVARAIRTGTKVKDALKQAGVKVKAATKKPEPEAYKPRHRDSVQDDTNVCPNCGCTWWLPVKGGHDCDSCRHPLGEPVGDVEESEPELGDVEQAELSKGAEKSLKKARTALGVIVRYCDDMKLTTKAKPFLEGLAKLIGK